MNSFDLTIISILITAFIFFSYGYNRGKRKGRQIGELEGVLKLRESSLYQGKCSLCGYKQDYSRNSQNKVPLERKVN